MRFKERGEKKREEKRRREERKHVRERTASS
jgi:hypothetical protein